MGDVSGDVREEVEVEMGERGGGRCERGGGMNERVVDGGE